MTLLQLLRQAASKGGSDLHCTVTSPPAIRIDGELTDIGTDRLLAEDTLSYIDEITDEKQKAELAKTGEVDFSFALPDGIRFRVNAYRGHNGVTIAVRVIRATVPPLDSLGLPEAVRNLANKPRGLVIVTGPTGAGKTTTLAAMLDEINTNRRTNIITLEDPVEYLHSNKKSLVNQREVRRDTQTFAAGLRAALREDPDVILVGEMRDLETIAIALTAAETGHLVLTTLHTGNAAQTIDRIIDVFPAHQQQQVRIQLSMSLQGIIAQQLLPKIGGGRVAAAEILLAAPAIRSLIREGKTHQLQGMIQTNTKIGMKLMDTSLQELFQARKITQDTALMAAIEPEKMQCGGQQNGDRRN